MTCCMSGMAPHGLEPLLACNVMPPQLPMWYGPADSALLLLNLLKDYSMCITALSALHHHTETF
jgi:hypothetical protein